MLIVLISISVFHSSPAMSSTALFYGSNVPVEELSIYDRVVVLPESVDTSREQSLFSLNSKVIAYLSVGETAENASYKSEIKNEWFIGVNEKWSSLIMDNSNESWREYLLENKVKELVEAGYSGLFLDTLDSYQLAGLSNEQLLKQKEGLVKLINAISVRYPELYIIVNRGFELMPLIASSVDEVLVESLFSGYNVEQNSYFYTSKTDQEWLIGQLEKIKSNYNLPVTVLDYLAEGSLKESETLVSKIKGLGFSPWITNGHLTSLGRGFVKPVPRKILAFYYSPQLRDHESSLHLHLGSSTEYLGYYLEYHNLAKEPLPFYDLTNRYAGIVSWVDDAEFPNRADFCEFLKTSLEQAMLKIAFIGSIPAHATCFELTNLKIVDVEPQRLQVRQINNDYVGKELALIVRTKARRLAAYSKDSREDWLQLEAADGSRYSAVFFNRFGGAALSDFAVTTGYDNESFWNIDPFVFLSKSLSLSPIPVLDATTENGLQILTSHIDGDGIASINVQRGKFAGRAILDEVLTQYDLPTTVSVIEAETSPNGLFPEISSDLEDIAKQIFKLEHVEIASHTYSHPFFWDAVGSTNFDIDKGYGQHVEIDGYRLTAEREVNGSVDYINENLSPDDKKLKVFLWSGDAKPSESIIKRVERLGLSHLNGADTKVFDYNFSMSRVWPVGVRKGSVFQIYAPIMNENVYTNLWNGPYFGYRNVINTFGALSFPRRLKPISIYYHFYSGEKEAGIHALKAVYDYAISQPRNAMYVSEYSSKAKGVYTGALGLQGREWTIKNTNGLNTVRAKKSDGYPALNQGVIGFKDFGDERYVHLLGGDVKLEFRSEKSNLPYLSSFVGTVASWSVESGIVNAKLHTHIDGQVVLEGLEGNCKVQVGEEHFQASVVENRLVINTRGGRPFDLSVNCG